MGRPVRQTHIQAFRWYMPGEPPYVAGLPDERQPCWDWTGPTTAGYGEIRSDIYGRVYAHRFSHHLFNGPVGAGLCVLHSCDRPICIQPRHLHAGTKADNLREAYERDRREPPTGGGRHPALSPAQVLLVRASHRTESMLALQLGVDRATIGRCRRGEGPYRR